MTTLFQWFGLSPTQEQKETSAMIKNGYPTKVVGRGPVMVDADVVLRDENFQQLRVRAQTIVRSQTASAA